MRRICDEDSCVLGLQDTDLLRVNGQAFDFSHDVERQSQGQNGSKQGRCHSQTCFRNQTSYKTGLSEEPSFDTLDRFYGLPRHQLKGIISRRSEELYTSAFADNSGAVCQLPRQTWTPSLCWQIQYACRLCTPEKLATCCSST